MAELILRYTLPYKRGPMVTETQHTREIFEFQFSTNDFTPQSIITLPTR